MSEVQRNPSVLVRPLAGYPVDPLRVGMVTIIAQFVLNIKHDKNAAGHPESKSENVDSGVSLVLEEVTEGDFQVVYEHDRTFLRFNGRGIDEIGVLFGSVSIRL